MLNHRTGIDIDSLLLSSRTQNLNPKPKTQNLKPKPEALILIFRFGPMKLIKENNMIFGNPIKTITNQISQTEKHKILRGLVELTYVHG